jgi:AcrR family transcriptional regulator
MAYNLFRVSCIRQGVYARSLDGTASNVRAADSGKLVRPAAELAWQLVDRLAERRDEQAQGRSRRASAAGRARWPSAGEAIRAAAFAQFAERGYPVVTVRDIMKACGLTQGALYNHFKSKDELLHDIIASTQAELERVCQQAVASAGSDPRAKLAAFVRAYVMRHCRLRVEALVANREISWLDSERVGDIRRSRRAIRDVVVSSWRKAWSAACSIRRRSTAGATSRRWRWRCSTSGRTSRCGTARAGASRRSRWRGSMATWRCASSAPNRRPASRCGGASPSSRSLRGSSRAAAPTIGRRRRRWWRLQRPP